MTGLLDGIAAVNSGTGALSITSNGLVNGQFGTGIHAVNTASAVGDLTISVDRVNGGATGIDALSYGTGVLSITATGNVSGGNTGITAFNASGTDLTISVADVTGATQAGIMARNYGTGSLSIEATGDISGGTQGIYARNVINGLGDLSITAVNVSGTDTGIDARNDHVC